MDVALTAYTAGGNLQFSPARQEDRKKFHDELKRAAKLPRLSFSLFLSQPLVLSPEPFQFGLVIINLPLLALAPRHQLIANQGPGDQPHGTPDGGASRRVAHSAANDSPGSRA